MAETQILDVIVEIGSFIESIEQFFISLSSGFYIFLAGLFIVSIISFVFWALAQSLKSVKVNKV